MPGPELGVDRVNARRQRAADLLPRRPADESEQCVRDAEEQPRGARCLIREILGVDAHDDRRPRFAGDVVHRARHEQIGLPVDRDGVLVGGVGRSTPASRRAFSSRGSKRVSANAQHADRTASVGSGGDERDVGVLRAEERRVAAGRRRPRVRAAIRSSRVGERAHVGRVSLAELAEPGVDDRDGRRPSPASRIRPRARRRCAAPAPSRCRARAAARAGRSRPRAPAGASAAKPSGSQA